MSARMSETGGTSGHPYPRYQNVSAGGIRPHHIGRTFVELGLLRSAMVTADGIVLDGSEVCVIVHPSQRLSYERTEADRGHA